MKKLAELQKQAFETNSSDFLRAVENRNFDDMADCYNEMMRHEAFGATDEADKYFFAQILDGYVIHLPLIARAKIKAIGTHFYYGLAEEYIYYTASEGHGEDDVVYDYFREEFLECEKVELTESHITFIPKAVKQLKLSVGDIVKICFCDENIIINKYEQT